ncbi:hypothetical protein RchiOBHm_Chr6g0292201 [Rosa chinensis]|uniref:Uncharacterized protein n=1 Tax=Rosa chinensis TaxID=74649 RepID=A0A2P6PWA9_ROSCH|nr:hypothetical protein RchiOBHm_Chr6g0292201 [Rosa chinensis]
MMAWRGSEIIESCIGVGFSEKTSGESVLLLVFALSAILFRVFSFLFTILFYCYCFFIGVWVGLNGCPSLPGGPGGTTLRLGLPAWQMWEAVVRWGHVRFCGDGNPYHVPR